MILDYSRVIVYTVGAGVAFFLGYSVASNKCQIKIQEKTIAEEQAINDNLQSAIHINNKIQNEVYHVTEDLYLSLADVDNEYSLIKSTPVISSYSGLSINTTGQDNQTVSDTSKVAGGISERDTRQLKDNAEKFQRLYEAELEKAKKCDMAIVKLNNLIDFYTKVYTTYSE